MSEPSKPPLTNNQQIPASDGQGNDNSNPSSNNNQDNQEMSHSIPTIQQQAVLHPVQSIPIQNSEETFNANNQAYPNFIQNNNFAIQAAAAAVALANQQPRSTSKGKNLKSNPLNLNMFTSIGGYQNFASFNPGQPAFNALAFGAKKAISRHKFSIDEDNALRNLVNEHGTTNWRFIAENMTTNRTARQCRDRWKNYLMPGIKSAPWTPEEDQLLEEKYAALGSQWSRIAKFFPNRTDINVKNRWATRNGRVNKAQPIMDMHGTNMNDNTNTVTMTDQSFQASTQPDVKPIIDQYQVIPPSNENPMNQNEEIDTKQTNENIGEDSNSQNDGGGGEAK